MAHAVPQAPPKLPEASSAAGTHGTQANAKSKTVKNADDSLHSSFKTLLDKAGSSRKSHEVADAKGKPSKESETELAALKRAHAKKTSTIKVSFSHEQHSSIKGKKEKDGHDADQTVKAPSISTVVLPVLKVEPEGSKHENTLKAGASKEANAKPAANASNTAVAVSLLSLRNTPMEPADKSGHKPRVFIVDARTEKKDHLKQKADDGHAVLNVPVSAQAHSEILGKTGDGTNNNGPVPVTFQDPSDHSKQPFALTPQATQPTQRDAATFQQWLVDKGYGQMVDQARITLKDQNAGEIRMTLYPESLGKVKVSLNLTNSSLAGHIFVENQTVKDVFQANLNGLMQSFRDGGWNTMSLQVSVGNGNSGGGQTPSQGQGWNGQAKDYEQHLVVQSGVRPAEATGLGFDRRVNLTA